MLIGLALGNKGIWWSHTLTGGTPELTLAVIDLPDFPEQSPN